MYALTTLRHLGLEAYQNVCLPKAISGRRRCCREAGAARRRGPSGQGLKLAQRLFRAPI
jgi:hypothetical protein